MSQKYFTGLNYTLGNEDTNLEIELVKSYRPHKVFSVCGSGGRALPLAQESVIKLTLSDLSKEQITLAKLREASYKQLSYQDFLLFWGYFPYEADSFCDARKALFLKLDLDISVREMFAKIYLETEYKSVLYMGKWERTFALLAKINRTLLGRDFDRILRFDNLSEQIQYYREHFPHLRWKAVLLILGNKAMFNALLYKGDFIIKNSPKNHFQYYHDAFEALFTRDLAQKSFFLQLCFYGKIKSLAAVPVEATQLVHTAIAASRASITYITEDLVSHLEKGVEHYDFLSLSDVPSYFKGDLEANFMQKIRPSLNPGAIIVNRYYLRVAECHLEGFSDITDKHRDLIELEKVQMYDIRIYRYNPIS